MSAPLSPSQLPTSSAEAESRRRVDRWRAQELAAAPRTRDRHFVTGLEGERYLFDTQSGLSVRLSGPAALLMEALFAEPQRGAELASETAARFSPPDVLEAMEQCTEVLRILRRQSTPPPPRERSRPGFN